MGQPGRNKKLKVADIVMILAVIGTILGGLLTL